MLRSTSCRQEEAVRPSLGCGVADSSGMWRQRRWWWRWRWWRHTRRRERGFVFVNRVRHQRCVFRRPPSSQKGRCCSSRTVLFSALSELWALSSTGGWCRGRVGGATTPPPPFARSPSQKCSGCFVASNRRLVNQLTDWRHDLAIIAIRWWQLQICAKKQSAYQYAFTQCVLQRVVTSWNCLKLKPKTVTNVHRFENVQLILGRLFDRVDLI